MASPGELVWKVSELLGIPEPTIAQHDRCLVVAGLRSKSGRGPSAAQMAPRDAARLLVAVLGSDQVKNSAQTVWRYSETRFQKAVSAGYEHSRMPALINLPPDHSFVEALEGLIAAAADGSLQHAIIQDMDEFERDFPSFIQVIVETPRRLADISIRGFAVTGHGRYTLPNPRDRHRTRHPSAEEIETCRQQLNEYYLATDLTQFRQITAKTILGVGEVLRV